MPARAGMMDPMSVDPRAATGFSAAGDAYELGRPSYPRAAVALLVRELELSPASTVLDLAAGTGKLTREVRPLVGRVIAVDSSEGMLGILRDGLPDVDARVGTAEAIPLPDGTVDAVVIGEAFQWFGTEEVCCEIARVLRPGGGLALLWNRARPADSERPWQPALEALSTPYREAAGPFPAEGEQWKLALRRTGLFAPLAQAEVDHTHETGPEGLVALVGSWSWIANLPDDERTPLLAKVRDLVAGQPRLSLRYRTEVYWTRRVSPPGGTRSSS
jgi:ubiquinone/menaquinone biosynthesis C-methylase UbiE